MGKDNVRMPSSGAGITQFYEESKSRIVISPKVVVGITVGIIILTLLMNYAL